MKKAIPTLNVRLLNRVKRQILKEPKQFNMSQFFKTVNFSWFEQEALPKKVPNCGTAACIAGWTMCEVKRKKPSEFKDEGDYERLARRALGLSENQSERLFYVSSWPDEFATPYDKAIERKQYARKAKIAAARIDHFIKTGE